MVAPLDGEMKDIFGGVSSVVLEMLIFIESEALSLDLSVRLTETKCCPSFSLLILKVVEYGSEVALPIKLPSR